MPKAKVRFNHSEMAALLRGEGQYVGVTDDLESRMARALETAKANAPVVTGTYRDSLSVRVVRHSTRTVVRVVSDAPHGMSVEAATGNLARALDSAGGA